MPVINGSDLTWEDLDAFAITSMTAEQLKQYQRDDRKDLNQMILLEGTSFFYDKSSKQKEFRLQ